MKKNLESVNIWYVLTRGLVIAFMIIWIFMIFVYGVILLITWPDSYWLSSIWVVYVFASTCLPWYLVCLKLLDNKYSHESYNLH